MLSNYIGQQVNTVKATFFPLPIWVGHVRCLLCSPLIIF